MTRATASADVDSRVDGLLVLTAKLRGAEAGYVAPGQDPTAAFQKFQPLLQDVARLTAGLTSLVQSAEAANELRLLADATSRLTEADAAAREQLLVGDVLTASHVIFGQASQAADAMTDAALRIRGAERTAALASAEAAAKQVQNVLAGVGALWIAGLLLLAFIPARSRDVRAEATPAAQTAPAPSLDLAAAADLCGDIARGETTPALNGLLARAVTLLAAEGVVVWMPSGAELLPAATAGYAPDVAARLSPIRRQDDNVTAVAWRDGVTATVDGTGQAGAVMAIPLFSGPVCGGVLALELRSSQADAVTKQVARMIAAQLATVVVGGPVEAPSSVAASS
jgi:hypothetical protein